MTVIVPSFFSISTVHLKPIVLIVPRITAQGAATSPRAVPIRPTFADANAADISFLNDFFDLGHHVVCELLEIVIGERHFFACGLFSGFFRLRLFSSGFLSYGLLSYGLLSSGRFNYRFFSLGDLNNLFLFSYNDFFVCDFVFFHF